MLVRFMQAIDKIFCFNHCSANWWLQLQATISCWSSLKTIRRMLENIGSLTYTLDY